MAFAVARGSQLSGLPAVIRSAAADTIRFRSNGKTRLFGDDSLVVGVDRLPVVSREAGPEAAERCARSGIVSERGARDYIAGANNFFRFFRATGETGGRKDCDAIGCRSDGTGHSS